MNERRDIYSMADRSEITLTCNGRNITVSREFTSISGTLRDMIADVPAEHSGDPIPLDALNPDALDYLILLCANLVYERCDNAAITKAFSEIPIKLVAEVGKCAIFLDIQNDTVCNLVCTRLGVYLENTDIFEAARTLDIEHLLVSKERIVELDDQLGR